MDTVAAFPSRRTEPAADISASAPDTSRALAVTATYLLSEEGRKASLLAGGDGRAVQVLPVSVPTTRLHLVSVDAEGVARLKLRPRYELDAEQRVVRVDAPPTYDVPPGLDELFREAARNHQLERTYQTERRAAKASRQEADRERRAQLAQAFLRDPAQRALVHPPPTPKQCYLATAHGRMLFEADTDEPSAREVPVEAHRRFRSDLRTRVDRNRQERAAQLEVHREKKVAVALWIAAHGTTEQQARHAAGMLPMEEAIEAMTDEAFAAVGDRRVYAHDGAARLQAYLRRFPQYADVSVTELDLGVTGAEATKATAPQWALVRELQVLMPDATVNLRVHTLAWKTDRQAPTLTLFGVVVTLKNGPFTLRREYAAPDAGTPEVAHDGGH
jgi:hypothetical protein